MAVVKEIDVQAYPMKVLIRPTSIELWVKRHFEDWKRVASIKAAKNNKLMPWSIRYFEMGTAFYKKFTTWDELKKDVGKNYMVELPNDINDKIIAKITMLKMMN